MSADSESPSPEQLTAAGLPDAQPLDLAGTALVAVLAQLGHTLLEALGPNPWYRTVLRHQVDGTATTQDTEPS